jgi:hypothetical protein
LIEVWGGKQINITALSATVDAPLAIDAGRAGNGDLPLVEVEYPQTIRDQQASGSGVRRKYVCTNISVFNA